MERNFFGLGGGNSRAFVMEERLGGGLDSAISISSAVHFPLQNKASALQKFMSFAASGEGKRKKLLFEPLSSTELEHATSLDAFEASNTACAAKATENSMGMERHGFTQFTMHASQNQTKDIYCASTRRLKDACFTTMSHSSIPIAMTSHLLKSHGSNPTATAVKHQPFESIVAKDPSFVKNVVGSFTPRNAPKSHMRNAQLTIFYAGSVIVYDDVSCHMAQEIMLLASKDCKAAINTGHPRSEASVLPSLPKKMISDGLNITTQTLNNTNNHLQPSCSEIKASHEHELSDDEIGAKSTGDLIFMSHNEPNKTLNTCMGAATSATVMPRAVPQARKASLARFLEKRKERVSKMMPYPYGKMSPDSCIVIEGTPPSSKCSSPAASISSNRFGSWYLSQTKSCSDSDESPSTKLEL